MFVDIDESDFPDLSDSDSEEDIPCGQPQHSNKTQETFHSMAEIASCSYEARQVGFVFIFLDKFGWPPIGK